MTPSNDLHELIQSLSMSEKRYFKLFTSLHGGDKFYLGLFDEIAKQEKYDEGALIEHFGRKKDTAWFSMAKKRLYNLILRSMENYYSNNFSVVKSYLHRAYFLSDNGLYAQCQKMLDKAKKIAVDNELYTALIDIFHLEYTLAVIRQDLLRMKKIMQELAYYQSFLENDNLYWHLASELDILIHQYGISQKKKYERRMEILIKHPALLDESKALSFSSKLKFFNTHALYLFSTGNSMRAKQYYKKIFTIFEKNPEKIKIKFHAYLTYLNNFLTRCSDRQEYDEIIKYIPKIKEATSLINDHSNKGWAFFVYSGHYMNVMLQTGRFDEAIEIIPGIIKEYSFYEKGYNEIEKIVFNFNLSYCWFGINRYDRCLYYINKIRNEYYKNIPPDIERFLKFYYLIVHYEAGHRDIIPQLIKSVQYSLESRETVYKFETIMLNFFANRLSRVKTKEEIQTAFQELIIKIFPLTKNEIEKNIIQHFNFIAWIESKIQDRPFAEVVRKKVMG